ncbi:unnamed protein product [Musa acuminata subsp. burmannicoides]
MKRFRGFKLGRRLVGVWRWVVRRRRPKHYLRLDTPSKSNLSKTSTMTTKIFDWGRHIAGRFCRGPHCRIGARTSADDRKLSAGSPLIEMEGEGRRGWTPPPKGHLAVYVGGEKEGGPPRRYMVPVIYFNHPLFGELLREAEEEFGFHHPGGITIPCPAAKFERVRSRIAAGSERLRCKRASSLLSS